ncbi:hypothetical protein T4D_9229 [Trichinella pseudospiralis]|uniref:Uncharacterized protein n=1 Tax=Trichinella pseudospiralis TaxID=6337 RepID=A0A0V1G4E8_TRIPS|nr:hypothetical protein T4D_9229 [Trichinella pseudospiralis]
MTNAIDVQLCPRQRTANKTPNFACHLVGHLVGHKQRTAICPLLRLEVNQQETGSIVTGQQLQDLSRREKQTVHFAAVVCLHACLDAVGNLINESFAAVARQESRSNETLACTSLYLYLCAGDDDVPSRKSPPSFHPFPVLISVATVATNNNNALGAIHEWSEQEKGVARKEKEKHISPKVVLSILLIFSTNFITVGWPLVHAYQLCTCPWPISLKICQGHHRHQSQPSSLDYHL